MFNDNQQTFFPVYYHLNGDAYQSWCNTRAGFYSLTASPYLWLDGSYDAGSTYAEWANDLVIEELAPTDVTISINAFRDGGHLDIRASVCIETGGTGKDMRIYFVQVLDHYPDDETYYRNAFRQVTTTDINVAANGCVDVSASMSLKADDLAKLEDVGILVWAQEPLNSGPADTYQASFVFNPPGIMADGFESGDVTAWD